VRRSTIRELGRRCKGNFGKTFAAADAGTGREAPRCPFRPRGAPRGRAPAARHAFPAPVRSPPGTSRHETGPSTTFGRHCLTMQSWAIIKPQVDGLRFSLNTGYGRRVGVKRSRWAGFVAETSGRPRSAMKRENGCLATDFQPITQDVGP